MATTLLVFCGVVSAQDIPRGAVQQANAFTDGNQSVPRIAFDGEGNYLVVWQDDEQQTLPNVYGRRFTSAGVAAGAEFPLPLQPANFAPAVVGLPDGGWMVFLHWLEGTFFHIGGLLLDRDGSPLVQAEVSNGSGKAHRFADAAVDPETGTAVVVWETESEDGSHDVVAARLASNLGYLGGEFAVSSTTDGDRRRPRVAASGTGGFVVVWESDDEDAKGVFARVFDAAAVAIGPEFQVNSFPLGSQTKPVVAMDAAGRFVVVWESFGQDSSSAGVFAQRFDASGEPSGSEFRVNQQASGSQSSPAVAMTARGDFVVSWQSELDQGPGVEERFAIVARRYFADGSPPGGEFVVAQHPDADLTRPSSTSTAEGDFAIAWQAPDAELVGVEVQLFDTNQLGDRVWNDIDGDGFQDVGEPGVADVLVHLYQAGAAAPLRTTQTDAEGRYRFSVLPPDDYQLDFVLPLSWSFTVPDVGAGPLDFVDSDADPITGQTVPVFLAAGVTSLRWDAGLRELAMFADGFESGDTSAWAVSQP